MPDNTTRIQVLRGDLDRYLTSETLSSQEAVRLLSELEELDPSATSSYVEQLGQSLDFRFYWQRHLEERWRISHFSGTVAEPWNQYINRLRTRPPVAFGDTTILIGGRDVSIHDPHSQAIFIQHDEILHVEAPPVDHDQQVFAVQQFGTGPSTNAIPYGITRDGRHVMQQQGYRGCAAACSAMLVMDHGKGTNGLWVWVRNCNFSDTDQANEAIQQTGLTTVWTSYYIEGNDHDRGILLERLLAINGSGILGVGGEIGHHVVLLDFLSMTENWAVIRDPFHGWSLTITAEALLKRYGGDFLQITRPLSGTKPRGALTPASKLLSGGGSTAFLLFGMGLAAGVSHADAAESLSPREHHEMAHHVHQPHQHVSAHRVFHERIEARRHSPVADLSLTSNPTLWGEALGNPVAFNLPQWGLAETVAGL